jgi:hypothetical protein
VDRLLFMQLHADPVITSNSSYDPPRTIEDVCRAFAEFGASRSATFRCQWSVPPRVCAPRWASSRPAQ